MMDTKFSVVLHILTMISEIKEVLSSQVLTKSVGTNASDIRRIIALLKNSGLITSQQGKLRYQLSKSPKEMSLLEIYLATQEVTQVNLFQTHQNANLYCPVGQHIENALTPIFPTLRKR